MDRTLRLTTLAVALGSILLARPAVAQPGWFWQNPLPQGNQLKAIAMVDANTVYAVGSAGTILRSNDGGLTWTIQDSGTRRPLGGISCTDVDTCTAVGADDEGILEGTILRTTNGGAIWTFQSTGVHGFFEGVACTDTNTCTVVGAEAVCAGCARVPIILRTTNGGATWVRQSSPSAALDTISCIDANTCTAVGTKILRTTNGGATWSVQFDVPLPDTLLGVFCSDANTCTAVGTDRVGAGKILRTTDAGITWMQQSSPVNQELWAVYCTDSNTCIAVGWAGTIVRTTNGGATWTQQSSGTNLPLFGVSFSNTSTGLAVGRGGTTLRTTDGGASWNSISSSITYDTLYGVSCPDANTCTAVGGDAGGARGTIVRTSNGGATWTLQSSGTTNILRAVSCPDANTCTAVGDQGTILRTTNGGTAWTQQSSGTTDRLAGVSCPDANTCTAVGGRDDATSPYGTLATILRTSDGGVTWIRQDPSLPDDPIAELHGVSFTDANTGTAVGAHFAIVRTYDGGAFWNDESLGTTPSLWSVSMTDVETGMAAADRNILRASPLGTPWTPVFGEGALSISCTDANTCTAVGFDPRSGQRGSTIVRTTDAGNTWAHQTGLAESSLNAVSCTDVNTCTAVGAGGAILRTNTGGS